MFVIRTAHTFAVVSGSMKTHLSGGVGRGEVPAPVHQLGSGVRNLSLEVVLSEPDPARLVRESCIDWLPHLGSEG